MKNYTAHPHEMVHVPTKFRENISMRFRVTVRKLNVTDRRTDRGHCNISRPGPSARREIKVPASALRKDKVRNCQKSNLCKKKVNMTAKVMNMISASTYDEIRVNMNSKDKICPNKGNIATI